MEELNGRWCVVANIVEQREHDNRPGTKHFSPGTKVYCTAPHYGDQWTRGWVYGKHRKTARFTKVMMAWRDLENFRVKQEFSPTIIKLLENTGAYMGPFVGGFTEGDKQQCEALAQVRQQRTYLPVPLRPVEGERCKDTPGDGPFLETVPAA